MVCFSLVVRSVILCGQVMDSKTFYADVCQDLCPFVVVWILLACRVSKVIAGQGVVLSTFSVPRQRLNVL